MKPDKVTRGAGVLDSMEEALPTAVVSTRRPLAAHNFLFKLAHGGLVGHTRPPFAALTQLGVRAPQAPQLCPQSLCRAILRSAPNWEIGDGV
jgi:hypothetical protein